MKLADCVEYLSRGKSPNYVDRSKIAVINQACIYWDGINRSKVKYHNPNSAYEKAVLQNGDVLINSTGTGTLGRAAVYYDSGEITIADSHVTIIRTDKNKVLPEFLCLYLRHESTQKELYSKCVSGSTNQIELSKEKLLSFPMPEIRVEVQYDIVRRLGKISRIITIRNKEISALDDLIKARFVEMFGTYPSNEKGWLTGAIRELVTEVRYGSSRKAAEGDSGKYPYLRMNNITYNGELDLSDIKTIDIPYEELDKCTVRRGDLLFNRTNSKELVGKTCVYNRDELMVLAGFVVRVRLNEKALPEFVSEFMNTAFSKQMLLGMCKAAIGQANINAQELQNIGIYIPPIELQKEFVSFKEQIGKSKSVIQKSLNETQILFDSLMQQYFG